MACRSGIMLPQAGLTGARGTTTAAPAPPRAAFSCQLAPGRVQPFGYAPRSSGKFPMRPQPSSWPAGGSGRRAAAGLPRQVAAAGRRAGAGQVELLLDNVPGKSELLSPKLDPEVRQRAERAIKQRGGRVTIGDVASTAGLSLDAAEAAVKALAADSQAALQVTGQGDIVYVFDSSFQDTIRNKSWWLRLEPALAGAKAGAAYLARVAFGTALIASVVTVYAAIAVAMSSRDDNNNRNRGGGGYYYGGGPRFYFDLTDLLWYWDPWYYRHRRERMLGAQQQQQGMGFLEAIFSWVFGDGDPNEDYDKRRWQAIGRYIQSRGGVVAAEELAPFLDLKPGQLTADRGRIAVDESYMMPVLARFNGSPEVDAAGNIVYSFPDLQQTATGTRRQAPPRAAAMEERWQLTAASAGQKLGAIALGALNFVGVAALTFMLRDPVNQLALARNGLLWVAGAMPWLQAYALAFFAIPFVRSLQNTARNAQIDARNEAREQAVRLLQRPDATLRDKLDAAANRARQNVISDRDVIYRSDRPLEQQPVDIEADNFEARLERRARERQQQQQRQQAAPQQQRQQQWGADQPPQWWQDQQAQQRQRDRR